jgi:hypothetical protein
MSDHWKEYPAEKKQLRSFKKRYLKSGTDLIKQVESMKECREILKKGLYCSKSDEEQKVQYSFDVLKTWELLRFPESEKLRSELRIDEHIEYYKAIFEGYKENDKFKMYFGNAFQKDRDLFKNHTTELNKIKQEMIKYVDRGLERERVMKKLDRLLQHYFSDSENSDDNKFRYNSALNQIKEALDKNPFMNPEAHMMYQEKIGAKKIIKKLYSSIEKREERKIDRIQIKNQKKMKRIVRMAQKGKLWLYNGSYFGFKFHQIDDLVHFKRKNFWKKLRKFPVAIIEMKEFNREYIGLVDYLVLKSYVHRPIRRHQANRIFKKIDTNVHPIKKYEAFEVMLGNNKLNQALIIKNSFNLSRGDMLNLKLDMEKRIRNYQKYENLFN